MGLQQFILVSLCVFCLTPYLLHQADADQIELRFVSDTALPIILPNERPTSLDVPRQVAPFCVAGMESASNDKQPPLPADIDARRVEAVIISPVRAAAVAAEVGGLIDEFYFELGDLVQQGQVVAEISAKRYKLVVKRASENLRALRVALARAQKDKEIKARLLAMDVSTEQELSRAEADVEITEHKVKEAETALEQALLDVEFCQVKAPFTGFVATRHKEPHEAVAPLDKLFTLVDSAKVYAVAYVPETLMGRFSKGKEAAFVDPSGQQFRGRVDRIEPIIDPKTDTRKVFVLIDNAQHPLEIGMSGSLEWLQ